MPNIKIKQVGNKVAASGVHFGGLPARRKLFPGEVVEIPEDLVDNKGNNILKLLLSKGQVEITFDPPNRPLDYASLREAQLTAPTFHCTHASDVLERERAFEAVKDRLEKQALQHDEDAKPFTEVEEPEVPAEKFVRRRARFGNDEQKDTTG